jgi:putative ABC transport system ATP-binding protein
MNIIGCLDKPTSGNYYLDGSKVSGDGEGRRLADIRNRKIGFVFQSFNLLARTTAAENAELPMIYNNTPSRRGPSALRRFASRAGGRNTSSQLGRQQQRVAIARA